MAGMRDTACHPARLALTEYLMLGQPLPSWLSQHVAGCPGCAAQADEVREVTRTLRRADPVAALGSVRGAPGSGPGGQPAPREDLGQYVVRQIQSARSVRRHRRRALVGAVAASLVLGCAGLIPALGGGHKAASQGQGAEAAVHLVRTGTMIPQPWGTEVPVALSHMRPGEIYQFMTENAAGQLVQAGSARAMTGTSVRTDMVTAMRRDSIVALLVEDQHGHPLAKISVTS
jgi:hypothetical protein